MNGASSAPDWPRHGGEAQALLARFGLPPGQPLSDFSANLNPLGPPAWVAAALAEATAGLARYPAPDYRAARGALARQAGVSEAEVLLTNGGAEAIYLTAAAHAGRRAWVVQPTFNEYARASRAFGLPVTELRAAPPHFALPEAALEAGLGAGDLLWLCRPNNPTAGVSEAAAVERLLRRARRCGARVVVDEAFIDFAPGVASLAPLLARFDNLILLRSLTKLYALPGLRLGYALASAPLIAELRAHQPPWSVNHLAAELVAPLLADHAFTARTRAWLAREHPRLATGLAAAGLRVVPSRANFFLVQPAAGAQASEALLAALLRRGILARHTHGFPGLEGGWLRLALREAPANARLLDALASCQAPGAAP